MKKKNKNIAGKIITVLQLIVSVICIVVAKNSGLFPRKYLTLFIVGDMLPSYRTMKYKSPIWGYFHVQKE